MKKVLGFVGWAWLLCGFALGAVVQFELAPVSWTG